MYNSKNISARTKCRLAKEKCFNRNIPILNILFYIGNGFMLKKQMITLVRIFYGINEHKANDMIADLLSHGLLIKKQATDTNTCIYVMTKFPLAMYHECSISYMETSMKIFLLKIRNCFALAVHVYLTL